MSRFTTNAGSADSAATFSTLAEDCERLAAVARKIDAIVSEKDGFRDDPKFQRLRGEFAEALDRVSSIAIAL